MKNSFFVLALGAVLSFGFPAWAETAQGRVSAIDYGSNRFEIIPPHNTTENVDAVPVTLAAGVNYVNFDEFDDLRVGDFVKIVSTVKSRTGGAVQAERIERVPANEAVIYTGTPVVTQTTQTVTTTTAPAAVVTEPATVTKKTETIRDGDTTVKVVTTTPNY